MPAAHHTLSGSESIMISQPWLQLCVKQAALMLSARIISIVAEPGTSQFAPIKAQLCLQHQVSERWTAAAAAAWLAICSCSQARARSCLHSR